MKEFKKLVVFSFQNLFFFIVPISAIFIFIPEGIIDVLFKRGEFDLYSLAITARVLFFYSFGIFFFCVIKLLVNTFYALKDTKTPAKTATLALGANIVLSALLMYPLKIGGVALGSSLAAFLNAYLLYYRLIFKIGKLDWSDTGRQLMKIALISLVLGVLSRFLWFSLSWGKYLKIISLGFIDLFVFVAAGYLLKLRQIKYFEEWLRKIIS